ncbi:MAG: hypothetical protein EHM32_09715 [Spirochaetales bacterium]|nr:MAG: hypothetical protein EHM32_09715 [Spirochaetales bacterium]
MKKFILFSIVILFAAGCSGSDGGDKSTGFKITPGELTELTIPDKSHDTSFTAGSSTCAASSSCYSTVFVGTVDVTSYVGIAISDNPSAENYKVMIYLPGMSSVPVGDFTLDSMNSTIKVVRNGTTTYSGQLDPITLNFSALQPDNTYIITGGGDNTVQLSTPAIQTLTINSIVAIKAGS